MNEDLRSNKIHVDAIIQSINKLKKNHRNKDSTISAMMIRYFTTRDSFECSNLNHELCRVVKEYLNLNVEGKEFHEILLFLMNLKRYTFKRYRLGFSVKMYALSLSFWLTSLGMVVIFINFL